MYFYPRRSEYLILLYTSEDRGPKAEVICLSKSSLLLSSVFSIQYSVFNTHLIKNLLKLPLKTGGFVNTLLKMYLIPIAHQNTPHLLV